MFDDKPTPQSNTPPASPPSGPAERPVSPSPAPSPSPAAPPSPQRAKEPEDIFDNVDPQKQSTPAAPPESGPHAADSHEPVIKTPPSVFTKKAPPTPPPAPDKPLGSSLPPPSPPDSPRPKMPGTPKKNITTLVIIVLIIIAVSAAAIWWFVLRTKSEEAMAPPEVVELFDQPEDQLAGQDDSDSIPPTPLEGELEALPSAPADTDGDGISDEDEIFLGTSINSPDTDNDGLYDKEEIRVYNTDPLLPDTDRDGWPDGEEVERHQDPLTPDPGAPTQSSYSSTQFKISLELLDGMVLESVEANTLQFNDNINQIKLYIYLAGLEPSDLTPDVTYQISEDQSGQLTIQSFGSNPDQTPYSTDLSTQSYQSSNGLSYLIRYVATKRADDHHQQFEALLSTFKFLK